MATATTTPDSNKIAFWETNADNEADSTPTHPVDASPCISTGGVVDIAFTSDETPADIRKPVDKEAVQPGGKFYSILRIYAQFEGNDGLSEPWIMATGWLVNNNLVVTAAHCVYNNERHAKSVMVCIGYSAVRAVENATPCRHRYVRRVAIPAEWMLDSTKPPYDIAFLQLSSPFEECTPIRYCTTEIDVYQHFAVVGYPMDVKEDGKVGNKIYEMKVAQKINLERTRWNMLTYQGDINGGLSGAPLIRENDFSAIGVHVQGGSINCAVVIGGSYGIPFQAYERAMKSLEEGDDSLLRVEECSAKKPIKYGYIA